MQIETIVEVLLSLRVNALQIAPEQRLKLIAEFVKNDIFLIRQHKSSDFLVELLQIESVSLNHAICSLVSVVACTPSGVDYLTMHGLQVPKMVLDILKLKLDECTDGSVAQRFCIAILQKMSFKDTVSLLLFDLSCAQWITGLLERSLKNKDIHSFCLDFGSALLANMFHNY